MLRYAIVEIAGKQVKVTPKGEILVNNLGDMTELECDKVILVADENGVKVGTPYLKESMKFKVLGQVRGDKIRVAKYHAKANNRKVRGSVDTFSKIVLA